MASGSKTEGEGLRDGADGLDEQETQQYRSLVGTALYVGQDRPENTTCNERSSEIHVWTNTCREVYAQTFLQVLLRGTRSQLEFSISRNANQDQGGDRCELGRELEGTALDVVWMDLLW